MFEAVCAESSVNSITVAGAVMYNNRFMECRPHLKESAVLNEETQYRDQNYNARIAA